MRPGQELGGPRGHAQVREAGRIRSSEAGRRSRLHEDLGCSADVSHSGTNLSQPEASDTWLHDGMLRFGLLGRRLP